MGRTPPGTPCQPSADPGCATHGPASPAEAEPRPRLTGAATRKSTRAPHDTQFTALSSGSRHPKQKHAHSLAAIKRSRNPYPRCPQKTFR